MAKRISPARSALRALQTDIGNRAMIVDCRTIAARQPGSVTYTLPADLDHLDARALTALRTRLIRAESGGAA
jgi:hypothetical protein